MKIIITTILLQFHKINCELLAQQTFRAAGYPSFHVISRRLPDGALWCVVRFCKNPPNLCRIESKSVNNKQLKTTFDCYNFHGQRTSAWIISQPSQVPDRSITILTEADIHRKVHNTKHVEEGPAQKWDQAFMDWFHNVQKSPKTPFWKIMESKFNQQKQNRGSVKEN